LGFKTNKAKLGMVANASGPNSVEADAGESQDHGQPGLPTEFSHFGRTSPQTRQSLNDKYCRVFILCLINYWFLSVELRLEEKYYDSCFLVCP
jgi:hypothetical protein